MGRPKKEVDELGEVEEVNEEDSDDEQPMEAPIELTEKQLLRQHQILEGKISQMHEKNRARNFLANLPVKFSEMEVKIKNIEDVLTKHNEALQMFKIYLEGMKTK